VKKIFILFLLSFFFADIFATHNRAGEITYVQLSDLTYEITITTFTYTLSFPTDLPLMSSGAIILHPLLKGKAYLHYPIIIKGISTGLPIPIPDPEYTK